MTTQADFNLAVTDSLEKIGAALSQLASEVAALQRKDAAADICERGEITNGGQHAMDSGTAARQRSSGLPSTSRVRGSDGGAGHPRNMAWIENCPDCEGREEWTGHETWCPKVLAGMCEAKSDGERGADGTPDASAIREQGE